MKKNVGTIDRIFRFIVAAVICYLFFTGVISSTLGTVLIVVAMIFAFTSLMSICPIYSIIGVDTCDVPEKLA